MISKWTPQKLARSLALIAALCVGALGTTARAQDPGQWSSIDNQGRNMISPATGLPDSIGEENVLWHIPMRARWQYMQPVVLDGKLFIGSTLGAVQNEALKKALVRKAPSLIALEPLTGERLWEVALDSYGGSYGVATPPTREGDRIYVKFGLDVVCMDVDGLADGNDGLTWEDEHMVQRHWKGHITGEKMGELTPDIADLIWVSNIKELVGVQSHDSSCGTPVIVGDQLWVPTSNASGIKYAPARLDRHVYEKKKEEGTLRPGSGGPNMVVLDKHTGRLLAHDPLKIDRIFHGQWSSPCVGEADGKKVVFWGDGYGYLHAFAVPDQDLEPIENPRRQPAPQLEVLWSLDCNPRRYRYDEEGNEYHYPFHGEAKRFEWPGVGIGPGEVISTPVFHDGLLYIAIGRDRAYSKQEAGTYNGSLLCIDPAKVDEDGNPEIVWRTEKLHRTQSTVSIKDGLIYVADMGGLLNCFDQATGEKVWEYDLGYMVECRSQLVADGKIYVGTDKRDFYVFKTGREPVVLQQTKVTDAIATPGAIEGVLYIGSPRGVTAYYGPGYKGPKPPVQTVEDVDPTDTEEPIVD